MKRHLFINVALVFCYVLYCVGFSSAHHSPLITQTPSPNCGYTENIRKTAVYKQMNPYPNVYGAYFNQPNPCSNSEPLSLEPEWSIAKCVQWGHTKSVEATNSFGLEVGQDCFALITCQASFSVANYWEYVVALEEEYELLVNVSIQPGYRCHFEWRYDRKEGQDHNHEYLAWSCYILYVAPYYADCTVYRSGCKEPRDAAAWGTSADGLHIEFPEVQMYILDDDCN